MFSRAHVAPAPDPAHVTGNRRSTRRGLTTLAPGPAPAPATPALKRSIDVVNSPPPITIPPHPLSSLDTLASKQTKRGKRKINPAQKEEILKAQFLQENAEEAKEKHDFLEKEKKIVEEILKQPDKHTFFTTSINCH